MSSFISAALGLIVVFLMAAGAIYSLIRIYRALISEPVVVADEAPAVSKPGNTQAVANTIGQARQTRSEHGATEPNTENLPIGKQPPVYIENDEEQVPIIFRRPAA